MRTSPIALMSGGNLGSTIQSNPIDMNQIFGCAIQAIYSGSPSGTLSLQASCDRGTDQLGTGVTNWSTVTGSSFTVSSAGSYLWNVDATYFLWLRVVYTYTSGSGSMNINVSIKGF